MKRILPLLFCLLIFGCASTTPGPGKYSGNQNLSPELIQTSITAGKTSKLNVRKVFGEPVTVSTISTGQVVSNPAAREMWSYYKSTYEGGGGPAGMKLFVLTIYFDMNGIVLDYVITEKST